MAKIRNADRSVHRQYEAYPYPPRDPADEAKRLITGSPSSLLEIEHYVRGERCTADSPFRVLIAGGGTGDATIMLASQLRARAIDAEIIHIDISTASLDIARDRAAARRLDSIKFLQASLTDLAPLGLEKFDYIDCCGVLHHLESPAEVLRELANALKPGGGIGLMLYGRLGRTGVYEAQSLLRLLADDPLDQARIDSARALLSDLPPTNWLLRNSHVGDHQNAGDAGIYDLLLHRRDRAYLVDEIFALAAEADLRITGFIEPARYDPLNYLRNADLRKKAVALTWPEQCAAAELIAGNMKVHICYLVPSAHLSCGQAREVPLRLGMAGVVPVLNNVSPEALAGRLKGAPALSLDFDGAKIRLVLPEQAAALTALVDGDCGLEEIRRRLGKAGQKLSPGAFTRQFETLYKALNGINTMLLR
ncbi:MAG: methyltransferase [Proteobacteria bacterium]|nr:methyltransferase [Pseudomonadota bacterium]MDA1355703.1 methyltransferase [Pseudomonadota bacterium]